MLLPIHCTTFILVILLLYKSYLFLGTFLTNDDLVAIHNPSSYNHFSDKGIS